MRKVRYEFAVLATVALFLVAAFAGETKTSAPCSLLAGIPSGHTKVIDLTYAINSHLPVWPGSTRPFTDEVLAQPEKQGYFARRFSMLEHYGTHLDAPAHFPPGKLFIDQIPVDRLFGPAIVIDVRDQVASDSDSRLTVAQIGRWEKDHGRIPAGAVVLLRTGWASRWPDQARYRNQDSHGVMHFPGYSVEAARLLIERKVSGLGIDTLSIDYGPSKSFEVHRTTLPVGLYHLENLANLDQLPPVGAFLVVAPIKLEGGSGGPVRVFAIQPG